MKRLLKELSQQVGLWLFGNLKSFQVKKGQQQEKADFPHSEAIVTIKRVKVVQVSDYSIKTIGTNYTQRA